MLSWLARSSFFLSIVAIAGAMGMLYAGIQIPGEAVAVNSVTIGDNFFQPASISVQAGSAVEWKNTGTLPHTATASSGSFDSGMLRKDQTFSQVFEVPGTFSFNCLFHPEMVGSVVVEAAAQPTAAPTAAPAANTQSQPQAQQPAAPAAPQASAPGTLPVGGGPPIDPGMARGAMALVALGVLFALIGGGAVFAGARATREAR